METNKNMAYEILEKNPSPDTILILLRRLKDKGRLRLVIQECKKAIDLFPNELRLRQLLAESYIEAGQITQAEMQLEIITEHLSDFMPSFKLLAKIFAAQGRNKESVNYLKIYSAHRPDDYEASQLLDTLKSPIEVFEHEINSTPVIPPEPDLEVEQGQIGLSSPKTETARAKKEKMIGILESWREKLVDKDFPGSSLPVQEA